MGNTMSYYIFETYGFLHVSGPIDDQCTQSSPIHMKLF